MQHIEIIGSYILRTITEFCVVQINQFNNIEKQLTFNKIKNIIGDGTLVPRGWFLNVKKHGTENRVRRAYPLM